MTKLWSKLFWMFCLTFPENGFKFVTQKTCKKLKKYSFQTLRTFAFELKVTSKPFSKNILRSFLWPNFDLSSFERLASLSQKIVSTSSLKNLQKIEKCSFHTLRTFVFELEVTSKPFSKKITITKFWFN